MRRLAILSALVLCMAALTPAASAQTTVNDKNHGSLGVFLDFTRVQPAQLNLFGVGARLGINVRKRFAIEGEVAYDFEREKTQVLTVGAITADVRSNLRMLNVLVGPKIQITGGKFRLFGLLKGGFVNFGINGPVTAGFINNQINTIADGDIYGVAYPGAGLEFNIGWLGVRAEAGDEIMFLSGGAKNNFRATIGPQIRF